jgi:hypothetical protein
MKDSTNTLSMARYDMAQGRRMPKTVTRFSDIVLDDPSLSLAAKGAFLAIGYMGSGCSVSKLAERTSDNLQVIEYILSELIEAGYIRLEESNLYIVSPSDLVLHDEAL